MYISYFDEFKLYLLTKAIVKKLPTEQIRYAPSQDFLYGLTVVKETTIEPLQETPAMLEELQVVTISDVLEMSAGDLVSVYGRVIDASEIQHTTNRFNETNLKRELTLQDQSTSETICCTIWSDVATNFVFVPGQVVLVKGGKLVVWTSKSISMTKSSKLYIDPKTKLAEQLKQSC